MHVHPARTRARGRWSTMSSRGSRTPRPSGRRQSAQRDRHHGRARQPASARRSARRSHRIAPRRASSSYGDRRSVEPVDADPQHGAFIAPDSPPLQRLEPLRTTRGRSVRSGHHDHSVHAAGEVGPLAARGNGSLVGSIVSYDADFVRTVVTSARRRTTGACSCSTATAPARSTGHGTPMPQLVHGGPGRAGGGEELGGIRAVKHYMQRTVMQGSPAVIFSLTGDS